MKPNPDGDVYKKRKVKVLETYFGQEIRPCEHCGNPAHFRYRCIWCDETGKVEDYNF